jgi:hypothetical protein
MIECTQTGLVYRNPQPYLRAMHAWHPSLAALDDGHIVCAFDLGEAPESLDYRTYLAHSLDNGQTWGPPTRLFEDPTPGLTTHTVRIGRVGGNELVGFGARFYRDDPNEGLTNRKNMGFVRMDLISIESRDAGRNWSAPTTIRPPLVGPAFEICHAVVPLADGRWLAPTQTLPDWDGTTPNGVKAIALVSHDRGRTWSDSIDVIDGRTTGTIYFEQSLVPLPDGRLLAVAWAYDPQTQETLPTPYAISDDGQLFSPPRPTGLRGQTAKLLALADGRILCVYRRDDQRGLWANLSRLQGDAWVNLGELRLWDGAPSRGFGSTTSDMLSSLSFGYPGLVPLPTGEVLVVFWCDEDKVQVVRWFRLSVRAA